MGDLNVSILVIQDQVGHIQTKGFPSLFYAKRESEKLYKKMFEKSNMDGTFVCAIQNENGNFSIEFNDETTYKVEIQENSFEPEDPLQLFCSREAKFRLDEYFHLDKKTIEENFDDVSGIIRDVIDEDADLYDDIDSKIMEHLTEQKIEFEYGK